MVVLRRTIGDVLRDERRGQQRTLREVSSTARVSLGYLSEVERGQKEASSELLASICSALDVPLSRVMGEVTRRIADEESARPRFSAEGVISTSVAAQRLARRAAPVRSLVPADGAPADRDGVRAAERLGAAAESVREPTGIGEVGEVADGSPAPDSTTISSATVDSTSVKSTARDSTARDSAVRDGTALNSVALGTGPDNTVEALLDSAVDELVGDFGDELSLQLVGLPRNLELILRRRLLPAA